MSLRPFLLAAVGVLVACGGDEVAAPPAGAEPPLFEVDRFEGGILIEARAAGVVRTVRGELSFDRATDRVELVRPDGVRLGKVGDGPVIKRRDGAELELTPDDLQDFMLVLRATHSSPEAADQVERLPDGYVVRGGDQEVRVRRLE